jgi:hypothetical protein
MGIGAADRMTGMTYRCLVLLSLIAHSDEVGRGFRAKPAACTD